MRWMGLCVAIPLLGAAPADAFGFRTHLWMAQAIRADVIDDCRVTLREGQSFEIDVGTCEAIRDHPGEFLAGTIGPDAFPDMAMGQTVIHPGLEARDGWVTADWLEHLLLKARTPAERAFSAGFLLHAAGDVFAHSYVNNYAGDIFILQDERVVERRHTLLEKYIDAHLPPFPMGESGSRLMAAPAAFVAERLIFDPEAEAANRKEKMAFHLVALKEARSFARRRQQVAQMTRRAEQARFDTAVADYWEAYRNVAANPGVEQARKALARARKRYDRAYHRLRSARDVHAFTLEWERSLTVLAQHYIGASLRTARAIIDGPTPVAPVPADGKDVPLPADDSPLRHYSRWFRCFGPVLAGEPVAIGEARCDVMTAMGIESSFASLRNRSLMGPGAASLYNAYQAWKRQISRDIVKAILDLGASRGWVTMALIRDLASTEPVTAALLDEAFLAPAHNKDLLVFGAEPGEPRVSAYIDKDLGLAVGQRTLDPSAFKPLDYAMLLGKLALLDRGGLREVVQAYGGDPARLRMSGEGPRYSILIDTVRSIDGSHQWQEFAFPFARQEQPPEPATPEARRHGYGPVDTGRRQGFSLYADQQLRGTVFARLFPEPFEGEILNHPRYSPAVYPYGGCPGDRLRRERTGSTGNACDYPD